MNYVYGMSSNRNFAVGLAESDTFCEVEVIGEFYSFIDIEDIEDEDEYERIITLRDMIEE